MAAPSRGSRKSAARRSRRALNTSSCQCTCEFQTSSLSKTTAYLRLIMLRAYEAVLTRPCGALQASDTWWRATEGVFFPKREQ